MGIFKVNLYFIDCFGGVVDHFLKVFIEHYNIVYVIMFLFLFFFFFFFFDQEASGILAPRLGIKPTVRALEGKVLATGPSGSPLHYCLLECTIE